MIERLLPRRIDNDFRGQKVALWLFGVLIAVQGTIGFNSIFRSRQVATSADGIPLDTFSPAAVESTLSLFALLGLSRLMLALLGLLALVRYRALVPLLFAYLLVGQLLGRAILRAHPVPRTGSPPGPIVILTLLALTAVGLVLSLIPRGTRDAAEGRK